MKSISKNLVKLITVLAVIMNVACSSHNSPSGSSSGGGGYQETNAKAFLEQAKAHLDRVIRTSPKRLYGQLPNGWDNQRISKIIREMELLPTTEKSRDGKALMFDYLDNDGKQAIYALKPFLQSYSSFVGSEAFGINTGLYDQQGYQLQLSILHEVSHIILNHKDGKKQGKTSEQMEKEAAHLAKEILSGAINHLIVCETKSLEVPSTELLDKYKRSGNELLDSDPKLYILSKIPFGLGDKRDFSTERVFAVIAIDQNDKLGVVPKIKEISKDPILYHPVVSLLMETIVEGKLQDVEPSNEREQMFYDYLAGNANLHSYIEPVDFVDTSEMGFTGEHYLDLDMYDLEQVNNRKIIYLARKHPVEFKWTSNRNWENFSGTVTYKEEIFSFSEEEYKEIVKNLELPKNAKPVQTFRRNEGLACVQTSVVDDVNIKPYSSPVEESKRWKYDYALSDQLEETVKFELYDQPKMALESALRTDAEQLARDTYKVPESLIQECISKFDDEMDSTRKRRVCIEGLIEDRKKLDALSNYYLMDLGVELSVIRECRFESGLNYFGFKGCIEINAPEFFESEDRQED